MPRLSTHGIGSGAMTPPAAMPGIWLTNQRNHPPGTAAATQPACRRAARTSHGDSAASASSEMTDSGSTMNTTSIHKVAERRPGDPPKPRRERGPPRQRLHRTGPTPVRRGLYRLRKRRPASLLSRLAVADGEARNGVPPGGLPGEGAWGGLRGVARQ